MSVLIKSNKIATSTLGTLKMLGTNPLDEFARYKARVVADGGTITNEKATKKAFIDLFNAKMYGNINTVVSGKYGVKKEVGGGVSKLYSLDGFDLIAVTEGGAPLPILTNENLDFSSNASYIASGGAYFVSSSKHILSKSGRFGMGVKIVSLSRNAAEHIAAATMLGEVTETTSYNNLIINTNKQLSDPKIDLFLHYDPLSRTAYRNFDAMNIGFLLSSNLIAFLSKPDESKYIAVRDGTIPKDLIGTAYKEIATEASYLSLGAGHRSNSNNLFTGVIEKFVCFNHGTDSSVKKLSLNL